MTGLKHFAGHVVSSCLFPSKPKRDQTELSADRSLIFDDLLLDLYHLDVTFGI